MKTAIREIGDQELVGYSAEADRKFWRLLADKELNPQRLEEAKERDDYFRERLLEDLRERLISGELIARGFREPISHGAPYLTISRHEWQVIYLERPDTTDTSGRAAGEGIAYVGLEIGKPGTRRLFGPGKIQRREERRAAVMEPKSVRPSEISGCHCGWRGCTESFSGYVAPPGWVSLIAYHSPKPIRDIRQIEEWRHDKILCPAHSKALDNLLYLTREGVG